MFGAIDINDDPSFPRDAMPEIPRSCFAHARSLSLETELALEAARRGGEVLRSHWMRLQSDQIREKGKGDLVTSADLAAEEEITSFLRRETPEAAVISEEGTNYGGSQHVWYVDPLDGTTNFVQQFPVFAVSIAFVESPATSGDQVKSGVVYNPVSGEIFYAARGRGSYLKESRLTGSPKNHLGDAVVATGFPRRYHTELAAYLREFDQIFRQCRAVRRAGAAALDLCWTAQGIFDAFWEHHLSPWDIAAGALIVEETGGICTDFEGSRDFIQRGDILGANPALHRALLDIIRTQRSGVSTDASAAPD
ncbi:inositol monophosphatase [bacterium]|nr:inositol monophosphatase [bacterium]MBU1983585.1 inositol monophosphatase [bacterium]